MNVIDKLRVIYKQYPTIAKVGYPILKKYWSLKSDFINYEYPKDGKATVDLNLVKEYNKERVFGPKKRICYAAFNNMHFQMNGDVTSCSFNYDVKIGNIKNQTIREIWNSKEANQFREDIGSYNLDKCFSCKKVLLAKNFASYPPLKYDLYSSENYDYPTQMSFETSDLCNYSCVMCNENLSSSIKKDKGIPLKKSIYTKEFIEQLKEFIPYLQSATFIGGEPLLIKSYYDIWEMIVSLNPSCKIHIQSNGSVLTERFLKLLPSGQFDIGISLDAANKEIFEKIRLKSNFDEVMRNIYTLKKYDKLGKISMNINFCPLTLNWHELPKVLELANELEISLKIVNVYYPFDLALIHQNSKFLSNVYENLQNVSLYKKNNISKKNQMVYDDFLKNIQYNITEAEKRDKKIDEIINDENEDYIKKLNRIIHTNKKFIHFDKIQKDILFNSITNFKPTNNDVIRKKIIANLIYVFNESNEEIYSEHATNFEFGINVANSILHQLENLYLNNLSNN